MRLNIEVEFNCELNCGLLSSEHIRWIFSPVKEFLSDDSLHVNVEEKSITVCINGSESEIYGEDHFLRALNVCVQRASKTANFGKFEIVEIPPESVEGALVSDLDADGVYRRWIGSEMRIQGEKELIAIDSALEASRNLLGGFGLGADEIDEATRSLVMTYSNAKSYLESLKDVT